jgi:hypothetical protein
MIRNTVVLRDTLAYVIFRTDTEYIRSMVAESLCRMHQCAPCEFTDFYLLNINTLQKQILKVLFFILLNVDMTLKEYVTCNKGTVTPVATNKACRFFTDLRQDIVVEWLKDPQRGNIDFLQSIKELYINS